MSASSSSNPNAPLSTADKLGANASTNAIPNENPSMISSEGAIGKQFNPDGAFGQIGEKIGGPFSKEGAIGRQFDASKDGIAGTVERAVDGPRNPAGSGGLAK
ncbi:hypothetical protein BU24DRAFT_252730 [Aaosphaeria arxii CBS 175.79]|uniref:Uncharacterized protein n=1 Tax=Aaosphaeria arxii CBS 175.79 TaxID=1450172 RepID=A0A6A5XH02_9PLEO|nr:uncharacterized protein BU24DRAFT_252730 [Aaosphaeria arxii CBS 175.79]KAF2012468.1 hypothetical protein BU24DRAFT_252730 [Aaosphaeria arxii CBS 175.79]